jgi:CheY-like chemotaxis protein
VTGGHLTLHLQEDQAVLLYQCVRELLFNVLKHSGVKKAHVTMSIQPDNLLQIEVQDHGRGFIERNEDRNEESSTKFGLFSIRERLEALGGKVVVTSAPQQGTHAILQVPVVKVSSEQPQAIERIRPIPQSIKSQTIRSPSEKIRILLTDDHKMVREGFCHILNAQSDMEVVGEAENGQQAITLCQSLRPTVVVMDLHMPLIDGLEATRQIKQVTPDTVVIGLSVYDTPEVARGFKEAGAETFVTKGGPAESLMTVIRQFGHQRKSS